MNAKTAVKGIIAALMLGVAADAAQAFSAILMTLGRTNPPIGHYEFCQQFADQCGSNGADGGPMELTQARWKSLLQVNYKVNSTIEPETDQQIYGVEERWTLPTSVGDCEDYVLLKRKMLVDRGVDPADLLMTVVLQPNGEGHAVLTVRTDHGDFILDNMRNKVLLWSETEYTYLKRQSSSNPGRWVKLQDGRAGIVGSVSQ